MLRSRNNFTTIKKAQYWLEPVTPLFLGIHGNVWLMHTNSQDIFEFIIVNIILLTGILSIFIKKFTSRYMNFKFMFYSFSGLLLIYLDGGVGSFFTIWLFLIATYVLYLNEKEAIFFAILIPFLYFCLLPFSSKHLDIIIVLQRSFVIAVIGLFIIALNRTFIKIAVEKEQLLVEEREEQKRREHETALNKKLEKVNKQLQRSNEDLEQFALIASHDLKAPVLKIILAIQLLFQDTETTFNTETKKSLETILSSANQMNELITDLLAYSKISEVKFLEQVDLRQSVEKAIENLSFYIQEKNAKVNSTHLPVIMANESLMISLFQNLIHNGLKFNKSSIPEVSINSYNEGDFVIISIKDNGIGILEESMKSLFVIFNRFELTNEFLGTGVGLAFCKKIVEKYDGTIWAESTRNEGSTFFIKIPLNNNHSNLNNNLNKI